MKYQIEIDRPALKFLKKQSLEQRKRILKAIYQLPDKGDIRPMSGYQNLYRLRVGKFRIIYSIINDLLIVQVLDIGNRGDVYKSIG